MWVVAQATILVTYAVVIGYGLAWFCNTAFYLGARWAWITKLYWLFDITIGLIIFCPLFLVSFLRVRVAITFLSGRSRNA